jgi:hypothetical protein
VNKKKITVPAKIDPDLWAIFAKFIEGKGYKQYRAVEAALDMFRVLPAYIRDQLMEREIDEARASIAALPWVYEQSAPAIPPAKAVSMGRMEDVERTLAPVLHPRPSGVDDPQGKLGRAAREGDRRGRRRKDKEAG